MSSAAVVIGALGLTMMVTMITIILIYFSDEHKDELEKATGLKFLRAGIGGKVRYIILPSVSLVITMKWLHGFVCLELKISQMSRKKKI